MTGWNGVGTGWYGVETGWPRSGGKLKGLYPEVDEMGPGILVWVSGMETVAGMPVWVSGIETTAVLGSDPAPGSSIPTTEHSSQTDFYLTFLLHLLSLYFFFSTRPLSFSTIASKARSLDF